MSMYKTIFNPFTGNLQFIKKDKNTDELVIKKDNIIECRNNKEYIVDSPQIEKFILPNFSSNRDFIRIYGRNDFGWQLYIPENVEVMFSDRCIILNSKQYIHSNEHLYDFIDLIYNKHCWIINNYSKNLGIAKNEKI